MTRSLTRRWFLSIAACAGLAGATTSMAASERLRWTGTALGVDVSIALFGPEEITCPALALARLEIEAYEARFSLFRADSQLVHLNAQGSLPDMDHRWHALLQASDRLYAATGAVLTRQFGRSGKPMRAAATLMRRALVDIGETAAIGGPWQIGLSDPVAGQFARVALNENAVAVSSPGALRIGENAQHIFHPHKPGKAGWSSAAVTAKGATLADGLSTAACFMSPVDLRACLADCRMSNTSCCWPRLVKPMSCRGKFCCCVPRRIN